MSSIRLLPPELINRIAAGEVVERPSSVIKELIENALDAHASEIRVVFRNGGQSYISIQDNGYGMDAEDLPLSIQPHATSKLPTEDLWNIHTFGFRGEALAAIASVARLRIKSRTSEQDHGWELTTEAGTTVSLLPCACAPGTSIEVKDLFFATPARLHFLKTPAVEQSHVLACFEEIAILNPSVHFHIEWGEGRSKSYLPGTTLERIEQFFRDSFEENAFYIKEERQDYTVEGWVSLPTFHRSSSASLHFFVNHRVIRDKGLQKLARQAYGDLMPKDRFPVGALFLTTPIQDVDVNVHPAKTQVRFKDGALIRQLVLAGLKKGLMLHSHRASTVSPALRPMPSLLPSGETRNHENPENLSHFHPLPSLSFPPTSSAYPSSAYQLRQDDTSPSRHGSSNPLPHFSQQTQESQFSISSPSDSLPQEMVPQPSLQEPLVKDVPNDAFKVDLGQVIGQVNNRYILAQNPEGLVLIDPHGAHERILYEQLKNQWDLNAASQMLMHPVHHHVTSSVYEYINTHQTVFASIGFILQCHDSDTISLNGIPPIFKDEPLDDIWSMFVALLDPAQGVGDEDCARMSPQEACQTLRHRLLAHWACRSSVFLGDPLTLDEMNYLLREMEKTPNSAQCNHGRRVYYMLSIKHLGHLFDRN